MLLSVMYSLQGKTETFDLCYLDKDDHIEQVEDWLEENELDDFSFEDCDVIDFSNIPSIFVKNNRLTDEFWENNEALSKTELSSKAFEAGYLLGLNPEGMEELYFGKFRSDYDMAISYAEWSDLFAECSDVIQNYFDYDAYARDLMIDSVVSENGYYFHKV